MFIRSLLSFCSKQCYYFAIVLSLIKNCKIKAEVSPSVTNAIFSEAFEVHLIVVSLYQHQQ